MQSQSGRSHYQKKKTMNTQNSGFKSSRNRLTETKSGNNQSDQNINLNVSGNINVNSNFNSNMNLEYQQKLTQKKNEYQIRKQLNRINQKENRQNSTPLRKMQILGTDDQNMNKSILIQQTAVNKQNYIKKAIQSEYHDQVKEMLEEFSRKRVKRKIQLHQALDIIQSQRVEYNEEMVEKVLKVFRMEPNGKYSFHDLLSLIYQLECLNAKQRLRYKEKEKEKERMDID